MQIGGLKIVADYFEKETVHSELVDLHALDEPIASDSGARASSFWKMSILFVFLQNTT
jgi:hypothetical protein